MAVGSKSPWLPAGTISPASPASLIKMCAGRMACVSLPVAGPPAAAAPTRRIRRSGIPSATTRLRTSPDSSIDSCVKLYLLIVHGLIRHAALPGQANLRRSGGVDLGSDNRLDLLEIYLSSALARASWIPRLVMHGIVLSAAGSHPSAAHIQVAEWV